MATVDTYNFPKGTPRHHRQERIACPLAGGQPTAGEHCLGYCPHATERGGHHFHCALLDEEAGAHAPRTQAQ